MNDRLTPSAQQALRKLGSDINIARRKRKMSADDFCERIGISRKTLYRLENGDPGIGIGVLAMTLMALGEMRRLNEILDVSTDDTGLLLDEDRLPRRVRGPRTDPADGEGAEDEPGMGVGF